MGSGQMAKGHCHTSIPGAGIKLELKIKKMPSEINIFIDNVCICNRAPRQGWTGLTAYYTPGVVIQRNILVGVVCH